MDFETIPTDDPIVSAVIRKIYQRSQVGIKKYGTTMDRDDLSYAEWLTHLQEELMDSIIYLEKLKNVPIQSKNQQSS
jgi:hypothetical protein